MQSSKIEKNIFVFSPTKLYLEKKYIYYIYHVIYPNNRYKTHQVYTVQLLLAAQRSRHPASVSTPSTVSNTLPSSWAGVHAPTCVKLHSFDINQQ